MTKIISFANLKGGVGKSTLNMLFAIYLKLVEEKNVVLLDCDPQRNVYSIRELDLIHNVPEEFHDDLYPIVPMNINKVKDRLMEFSDADYILIDFPGNIEQDGVIDAYYLLDYVFVPTNSSLLSLMTSQQFGTEVLDKVKQFRNEHDLMFEYYGVFNSVSPTLKEFKEMLSSDESPIEGWTFLKNYLPTQVNTFQVNITSYKEFKSYKGYSMIRNFCHEVFNIINAN